MPEGIFYNSRACTAHGAFVDCFSVFSACRSGFGNFEISVRDIGFSFEERKEFTEEAFDFVEKIFCVLMLVTAAAEILVLGYYCAVFWCRLFCVGGNRRLGKRSGICRNCLLRISFRFCFCRKCCAANVLAAKRAETTSSSAYSVGRFFLVIIALLVFYCILRNL